MFGLHRHNCVERLENEGWEIFDPEGWATYQETLCRAVEETVKSAQLGVPSHVLAGGLIGYFWDELGDQRAEALWNRLSPAVRLPRNGRDAARTAQQLVVIFSGP